jgi:hypothetical protein
MYVILTKNSDNTWDGIHDVTPAEGVDTTVIDAAFASGFPIIGMNASAHKSSAVRGATWNGTSFSGKEAGLENSLNDEEVLATINRYVFLCDNKVVFSMTLSSDSANTEMFDAAFAGETILVKTTSGPFNKVGKTFNWDGTDLTLV